MQDFPQRPISAGDAAKQLGVSVRRVQALAASGVLPSGRIGNRLVFDARIVGRRASELHPKGRPFDPEVAWAVLAYASGLQWPEKDASLRWRYRRRSADLIAAAERHRFFRRAELHPFRAVSADIDKLKKEQALVLSGASAADEFGIDIMAPGVIEAYVDDGLLSQLRRRYWMEPSNPAEANVLLRVVPDRVWEAIRHSRYAPQGAAAIDLLESDDDRSQRAGKELLDRLAANL
jgi:hypothetical protein